MEKYGEQSELTGLNFIISLLWHHPLGKKSMKIHIYTQAKMGQKERKKDRGKGEEWASYCLRKKKEEKEDKIFSTN